MTTTPSSLLRDARPADVPELCAAERAIVRAYDGLLVSEPEELLEAHFLERIETIAGGQGKYLVVQECGRLVAHGSLWPMGLRRIAHVLRLDLCVHAGHWRQGHGERLLRALLAWARADATARKVELLVRAGNGPALALYHKLGFVEEGRLRDRIRMRDGTFMDDIAMAIAVDRRDDANARS